MQSSKRQVYTACGSGYIAQLARRCITGSLAILMEICGKNRKQKKKRRRNDLNYKSLNFNRHRHGRHRHHSWRRLPTNLGEERHGKLKAAQCYSLFAYIIPLVIFDLNLQTIKDINTQSNREKFIMNTAYLMQCTHVLFACKLTGAQINLFESNYKKYNELMATLFCWCKAWGPLPRVAEFTGERLIGFLQKIRTNSLIDKMNGTMMRRGCQIQCLMDKPAYQSMIQHEPTKGRSYDKKKIKLTDQMYGKIQNYLVKTSPLVIHRELIGRRRAEKTTHGMAIPLRLKNRFRLLLSLQNVSPARAKNNTFACMILHNILNHRGSLYVHCWDARNPQELVFSELPDTPVLDNTIDEDPMNTVRDIICDFLYRVSDDSTT
ncbi:hypothetical protein VP01_1070g1 [Puccinia sorghi]|uniref:DDE Tnp4 domain-containing protein n=1 Tax=Puccinia sorghi TaxID=27349 RepID=A0A0L6VTM5_9BASI|nr:hypothetical protein VP01_1070g1 [Puccinia sorghi]